MIVSVIVPVKNPDFDLLDKALCSVYAQTYTDYEILLVNDGSDEPHSETLRKIAGGNPKIRLLEIAPSGVSGARNYAASLAQGDVITYLDGDDFISPVCFEEAVRILENNDLDALWGGTIYGSAEELLKQKELHKKDKALSIEELQNRLVLLNGERQHQVKAECIGEPYRFKDAYINRGIAGRFIKKEKLMEAGIEFPLGIRFYEDAIWNLRMLGSMKVSYVESEWYYYLENEKSVSNSYNPNIVPELEKPLSIIREMIDMDNPVEYAGYTRILMDSLRYVSKCLINNPKWNGSSKEKRSIKKRIYKEEPWREIGTEKFKTHAQERDCKKAFLYRKKLLLFIWKYRWK